MTEGRTRLIWLWQNPDVEGEWVIGDEEGEFARASHPQDVLRYIRDLMECGTGFLALLDAVPQAFESRPQPTPTEEATA